jgi:hypothetical protein
MISFGKAVEKYPQIKFAFPANSWHIFNMLGIRNFKTLKSCKFCSNSGVIWRGNYSWDFLFLLLIDEAPILQNRKILFLPMHQQKYVK